jgi:hypothetical protein
MLLAVRTKATCCNNSWWLCCIDALLTVCRLNTGRRLNVTDLAPT